MTINPEYMTVIRNWPSWDHLCSVFRAAVWQRRESWFESVQDLVYFCVGWRYSDPKNDKILKARWLRWDLKHMHRMVKKNAGMTAGCHTGSCYVENENRMFRWLRDSCMAMIWEKWTIFLFRETLWFWNSFCLSSGTVRGGFAHRIS